MGFNLIKKRPLVKSSINYSRGLFLEPNDFGFTISIKAIAELTDVDEAEVIEAIAENAQKLYGDTIFRV
jgi:hypothetical protein